MNAKTILLATAIALAVAGTAILIAAPGGGKGKPGGGEDSAGNNLSFPVIWAEGVEKTLRGEVGMVPLLQGAWWYWWGTEGTDPDVVPLSCPPDPDNQNLCDDTVPGQATGDPPGTDWVKAYLQKDLDNVWQAGSADGSASLVDVDWIDWGDNLESVDWYTRSQVRTEVVLFKDLVTPMTEYEMRHVDGWGITEVHGLAYDQEVLEGPGDQATIYSPCARLTIQKLLVERENVLPGDLAWQPSAGWTGAAVNTPIFNMAVYEAGDGPGYYSAEINVKGRIIYGYTWNVRRLNDMTQVPPYTVPTAAGDYRVTFSLDEACGVGVALNTSLGLAQIIVPTEEELEAAEEEVTATTPGYPAIQESDDGSDTGGAVAVLDTVNNLTYIDVRIRERSAGKGGGNKGGGNKGGGGKGR